jgi:hypothetical protein
MARAVPNFPDTLPCPIIEGTSVSYDAGLIRTQFDGGNSKQRRMYATLPSIYPVQWVVPQIGQDNRLEKLMEWINEFGWAWFYLGLPGILASIQGKDTALCRVRLISDIQTELLNTRKGYYWRVRSALEWTDAGSVMAAHGGWVIAKGPGDPSVDWIIAGDLITPSLGGPIIGGDPSHPSL